MADFQTQSDLDYLALEELPAKHPPVYLPRKSNGFSRRGAMPDRLLNFCPDCCEVAVIGFKNDGSEVVAVRQGKYVSSDHTEHNQLDMPAEWKEGRA